MTLVANHSAMNLQVFTQYDSYDHNIMNNKPKNLTQILRHTRWILHLEVRTDIEPMIFKPCGHLNHVHTDSVSNERAMALFVWYEVLLPMKILYERCKLRVKRVRYGQVDCLCNQFELVGAVPDLHETRIGYALYPLDHALVFPCRLILAIQKLFNNILAPVQV